MARPMRPEWSYGLTALGLVVGLTILLWAALRWPLTWYHGMACWLLVVNGVTLAYYRFDKGRAGGTAGRVPEIVLHGLMAAGGTGGAYLGMYLFRHKTIKGQFQIVFWFLVVMQLGLVAALGWRLLNAAH
ncbi:MAG: DUF1294 domain-containing protein [Gemmataceae bacterium]